MTVLVASLCQVGRY